MPFKIQLVKEHELAVRMEKLKEVEVESVNKVSAADLSIE